MTTILSINGSLLYVPFNQIGVISICNNKFENELACFISGISDNRVSLNIGDIICIRLIAIENDELDHEFIIPYFTTNKKQYIGDMNMYGIEVCDKKNIICMPFIDGGAVTFVATIKKNIVYINAGSITSNKISLDYYDSKLSIGDEICITLKKLDFISSPLNKRDLSNHRCCI